MDPAFAYEASRAQETGAYRDCLHVHDLPDVFHYWSNRHVRPKLLPFGFDSPNAMFARCLEEQCREGGNRIRRFVSLGAGNCDLEIALAAGLRACGYDRFVIDCLDMNTAMLARGRICAERTGVARHLEFTECDLNAGIPDRACEAVVANQSLHHVQNLEGLFERVKRSLNGGGIFAISDIIGRNGHRRWPEALDMVHEFWRALPPSYRFNAQLGRYEELLDDWDCSGVGFEGIRSQDILRLLLREFHFHFFLPFGNAIDPFVDRAFGPHFDVMSEWDRAFIDRVHRTDDAAISSRKLTPTHMLAVVGTGSRISRVFPENLPPESCVRRTAGRQARVFSQAGGASYRWGSWPHASERELHIACRRLSETAAQLKRQTSKVASLETELVERTAWAHGLERQLEERASWAHALVLDIAARTEWARNLEKQLDERTFWALALQSEVDEQRRRVLQLAKELDTKARDVAQVQREIQGYLHHPHRFVGRLAAGVCRRIVRFAAAAGRRIAGRMRRPAARAY